MWLLERCISKKNISTDTKLKWYQSEFLYRSTNQPQTLIPISRQSLQAIHQQTNGRRRATPCYTQGMEGESQRCCVSSLYPKLRWRFRFLLRSSKQQARSNLC
ncbi:hypothetical protein HanRHA438_Chr02g0054431 [Helianthus annuus]|nr:hypothetical protein HanRHA438_Chr02g0054431 [Helianthus annuus]